MTLKLYVYSDESNVTVSNSATTAPETIKVQTLPPAFRLLPEGTFADTTIGQKNRLSFAMRRIGDDIDSFDNFIVEKPAGLQLIADTYLTSYTQYGSGYVKLQNGIFGYRVPGYGYSDAMVYNYIAISGSATSLTNNNAATGFEVSLAKASTNWQNCRTIIAIKLLMPTIDYDYDSVHLGLLANIHSGVGVGIVSNENVNLNVVGKSFMGAQKTLLTKQKGSAYTATLNLTYDSIMDEYYSPDRDTHNENFFIEQNTSGYPSQLVSGYKNYKLEFPADVTKCPYKELALFIDITGTPSNISNVILTQGSNIVNTEYIHYAQFCKYGDPIMFLVNGNLSAVYYVDHYIDGQNFMLTSPWTDATVIDGSASYAIPITKVTINELCLIFCKSASVKTELYAPMQGRTFNGPGETPDIYNFVWDSRRGKDDLIADPIDLLEHIKRLGNWSETGDITKIGKEYAPHAKINTGTGIGGFDYFHLVYIRGCRPSFQILEKSDADIIKLSKDICSTYFLSSYQNENGEECVLPLDKDSYNAMKLLSMRSFTYADLYGDISDIQEPDPQNIYCQPVINYNYNYASDKYSMMLGVINASAPAFNRSCVVGFSTDDDALAQELWQYCHDFYLEFGNIETPSGDLTDKKMIRSYADATWYLKTWIWWMKTHRRRFELITNYERGIGLYPGMLVNVNLKHQTHGNDKICRVEKVGLSLHKNTATLGLIMIDE